MKKIPPYLQLNGPVVLAHQGNSYSAPGNTLPAFQQAVELGADILETDIHWTRDGVIVICHDATVDRTSNGSGRIQDMTFAELKQFDFGYRFTADEGKTFPYRGCGIQISSLREVLLAFPHMRVNMDIKPRHPASLRQLVVEICESGAADRVMVASFHHAVLTRFRNITKAIATSASTFETALFMQSVWLGLALSTTPYSALQVPWTAWGIPVTRRQFVERAHEANLAVHVWTVDDPAQMRTLLCMGVDGIVTNRPRVGADAVRSFRASSITA